MSDQVYDYCIVGAGAAGLHLAIAIAKDPWFDSKSILIIDKSDKTANDRTWCFWEKGKGKWDEIIEHKWAYGKFMYKEDVLDLTLSPYSYKKLNGIDFYNYARKLIGQKSNIDWIKVDVSEVVQQNGVVEITGGAEKFKATHCFDSRITEAFASEGDKHIRILQHFKGWSVVFRDDVFDPDSFTMMDFRIRHQEGTSFTYILPVNTREALIEFTLFDKQLLTEDEYDVYIKKYISTYFANIPYEIKETEYGVIPMTDFPFHRDNSATITKIGTAGSWVRPSSGYSFKYAEKNVQLLIKNLKAGQRPDKNLLSGKYRFYDTLLLDILYEKNHLGPKIFYQMYSRNPVQKIFKFLDGESNLSEDIGIISTLDSPPFLHALVRYLTRLP